MVCPGPGPMILAVIENQFHRCLSPNRLQPLNGSINVSTFLN
jgi:hypothetical protein